MFLNILHFHTEMFQILWILLPLAYAEIHYTLKGFSLVFRKRPEILTDAPWRVEYGRPIPLMILIRDADRFPVQLNEMLLQIQCSDGSISTRRIALGFSIKENWWHRIFELDTNLFPAGRVIINARIEAVYLEKGKKHYFLNDNLWSSSHHPLTVHLASDPLPRFENWHHGDLHYHSAYTADQVEYGAPLEPAVRMAAAMGLEFMAVTDHSYDLDDPFDHYLERDPDLVKWKTMQQEIERIQRKTRIILLPGEEVSCGNHRGENVHLLLINNRNYFPGSGDSNERWFRNRPDLSISDVLNGMDADTLAFAAHPGVPFAPLQRILLRRGIWHSRDFRHERLLGMQIYNGTSDRVFRNGRRRWIQQLLTGYSPVLIAGNDAHGNFNRNRKLGQPFLYITEGPEHTFGRGRTIVSMPGGCSRKNILNALKQGRSCITTGPVVDMRVTSQTGHTAGIGGSVCGGKFNILIRGLSTQEFGRLHQCNIYLGDLKRRKETLQTRINKFPQPYYLSDSFSFSLSEPAYIRAELISGTDSHHAFCLSNTIRLNPD
jgi:hypothetical protein